MITDNPVLEWERTFDAVSDMIAIVDASYRIVRVNRAMITRLNLPKEQIIGQHCFSLMHETCEPVPECPHCRLIMDGQEHESEFYVKPLDAWLLVKVTPVYDKKGTLAGSVHVARDVTDERRVKKELQDSETRLKALSDASFEAIFLSEKGICTDLNKTAEKMFGYTRDEAFGKHGTQWIAEEDRDIVIRKMQSGYAAPYEVLARRKDGTTFPAEIQARTIEYMGRNLRITALRDITDRKEAVDALMESETRFRTLVENMQEGLGIGDREGRLQYVNPALCQILGMPAEELIGRQFSDFVDKDDTALFQKQQELRKKGEANSYSLSILREDGTKIHVYAKGHPLFDGQGNYAGSFGVITDITDIREAEEKLAVFKTLADKASYGMATADLEGVLTYCNETWAGMHQCAIDEILGKNLLILHDEEDIPRVRELNRILLDKGSFSAQEVWHSKKDGTRFPTLMNGTLIRDESGKPLFFAATAVDITEWKDAENALKNANIQLKLRTLELKALLEAAKAVLEHERFEEAAKSIFQSCSKAINAPAGYIAMLSLDQTENQVVFLESGGKPCTVPEDLPMPVRGLREQAYQLSKAVYDNDFVNSKCQKFMPEGHVTLDNVLFAPLILDGKPVGLLGFANKESGFTKTDLQIAESFGEFAAIALRNSLNLEALELGRKHLREAKEIAESANRTKGEFLANMSHEIRTPLNGVLGMLQLLGDSHLTQEQKNCVQTAIDSGKSLLNIINDILDFSKVEAGKIEICENPFELESLLGSVIKTFSSQASQKGIRLYYEIPQDMHTAFLGDNSRLRQILFNLIGNAIKFTQKGEIRVLVKPLAPLQKDIHLLEFLVEDTGIGIPADKLDTIFEPFSQVDGSYTRNYEGTGLGLGIVKRLVELMGGTIRVESVLGKGTLVCFSLPLKQNQGGEVDRTCFTEDFPENDFRGRSLSLRILLAEDNPVNQVLAKKLLEKNGHRVKPVGNGKSAIEALGREEFDLVLMDVQMPVMDGVEATRLIRRDVSGAFDNSIPIIAMTAHAMKGDRKSFLDAGMDDYIAKPIDMQELIRVILRTMAKHLPFSK